jgi:hypothetical protein
VGRDELPKADFIEEKAVLRLLDFIDRAASVLIRRIELANIVLLRTHDLFNAGGEVRKWKVTVFDVYV